MKDSKGNDGLLCGIHTVSGLLRRQPGAVRAVWLQDGAHNPRHTDIETLAAEQGIRLSRLPLDELERRAGGARHQGVIAQFDLEAVTLDEGDIDDVLAAIEGPPLLLVLDGVQDPHNLGACLRTADAAGVHAVIAPKDRATGLTPVVCKVASGAVGHIPFLRVTNLARTLRQLRDADIWIAGAAAEGAQSLYETDLTLPIALVLGAEGTGLRRLTREHCDWLVSIPMAGAVESLNVSVASGICLFESRRQRLVKVP
ncbi:MAG: 23S rRNA (guanosine(2251)-2'-O)-methyltransferase RlmB [Chromatiales bacterium]|jgi:23S rRNA (guanosine2251-2'-O)-methyltransferase|nr:23S rRNA (guanosine(2251)-2'-O)-methyltransferase RlmB [Chromatiales bacterium]